MIKHKIITSCLLAASFSLAHAQDWKIAGDKIHTPWSSQVDPAAPHPEYPRPLLKRQDNWKNLNGLWQYAITPRDQKTIPTTWTGKILVPYAIESALSGVGKTVTAEQALWYHNQIEIPKNLTKNQLLLHFGAVDWQCDVYVNNIHIGRHEGGFDAFSFDITDALRKGQKQDISIRVWDPTDVGPQPRGKQINNPHGIWYTPVTGIWQTLWLESVPQSYIVSTKQTPDIDKALVHIESTVANAMPGDKLFIQAYDNGKLVNELTQTLDQPIALSIANPKLWSPSSPHLYDLKIKLIRNGKTMDEVDSYFAMRKISAKKENGIERLYLNNEFVFQYGPLDQGWWPDGLLTAPTDDALKFDIEKTKEMGFNMIRKHIKVEPARWYRHCDSIGILVWQDMPSGDLGGNIWDMQPGKIRNGQHDKTRTAESEEIYRREWKAIMKQLHNYPSIVMWVPFNEAWGQFKTKEIVDWTIKNDPSRLVNGASGGNFNAPGHLLDIHNYPEAAMPDPVLYGDDYILALGEFGGLGLPIENHTWQVKDNWGYQSFKTKEELKKRYEQLIEDLSQLIPKGLSAAVYTQTTDVEIETNGLMTYDREVLKIPAAELNELHKKLYK